MKLENLSKEHKNGVKLGKLSKEHMAFNSLPEISATTPPNTTIKRKLSCFFLNTTIKREQREYDKLNSLPLSKKKQLIKPNKYSRLKRQSQPIFPFLSFKDAFVGTLGFSVY